MSMNLGENLLAALALRHLAELVQDNDDDNSGSARIREVNSDDEETSSEQSNASTIEAFLRQDETISSYMEEKKYEEAYGLVKKQYKQGPQPYFVRVLINYYVVLMQTNRPEKAFKVENEILTILQDTIEVSPSDAQRYGEKRRKNNDHLEAILWNHIAQELCKSETDPAEIINTLHRVALSTKLAASELVEKRKIPKLLVRKHIIPEMKKTASHVSRVRNVERRKSCVVQALCLHHVENTQHAIGDLSGRESTQVEAINVMESVLGNDAQKYHVYSDTLNNLGQTYLSQNRPRDAIRVLTKAVETKPNAEDYTSAAEKRQDMQMCQNGLRDAKRMLQQS